MAFYRIASRTFAVMGFLAVAAGIALLLSGAGRDDQGEMTELLWYSLAGLALLTLMAWTAAFEIARRGMTHTTQRNP